MLKKEENMAKLGVTFPLKQIITYEWRMKVGAMLTAPPPLNRWPQEGHGMQGRIREDYTTNMRKTTNECGERDRKGANRPKKGVAEVN